jgi:tRNA(fMet)-specific endonuclease VapC
VSFPVVGRRDSFDEYIQRLPARFPVLPYDQRAADWHAAERARLERIGRTPPYLDGQIAAVAATRGLILVTRDVRDFVGFTDLRVESWWMEESS